MFEIFVYSPRVEGVHLTGRSGRPRRAALVRPSRGLPHRDSRAGEGPDREECRHRAGRRQGRVRREVPTRGPGRAVRRGRGLLPHVRPGASRRDRQPRRRPGRCRRTASSVTTGTTPTSSSPRTRGPRRSPTWRTRFPGSTSSGSETPSPPAGRRATTIRPWGSPPAAPGCRCGDTSAPSASTSRTRTSPWRASETCPVTCSATACFCPRTSGWSPPSTTGTSSSTLTPIPHAVSRSGRGCSRCPARRGRTTTLRDLRGRRGVPPDGQDGAAVGRGAPRPRRGRRGARAGRAHPRDPSGAGGPALERRGRHLRQGVDRVERRRRRQEQRRRPDRRWRAAVPGRRRGREPGLHPARPASSSR